MDRRRCIRSGSWKGRNLQGIFPTFGSQRALKTVEDFTEFELRAAYFDGDPVMATKKGVNILERWSRWEDRQNSGFATVFSQRGSD